MRRFLKVTVVTFFLLISVSTTLSAMEQAPAEALKAARAGLADFSVLLKQGPATPKSGEMRKAIQNASIETGFRVYTTEPAVLMRKDVKTLAETIKPMDTWRFIIQSEEKAVALVTVALVNGEWKAVSFGAAGIAGEMMKMNRTWSKEGGYSMRFVRIHQVKADLIQVSKDSDILGYTPLDSAKRTFEFDSVKFDSTTLLQDYEVVAPLKKLIEKIVLETPEKIEER